MFPSCSIPAVGSLPTKPSTATWKNSCTRLTRRSLHEHYKHHHRWGMLFSSPYAMSPPSTPVNAYEVQATACNCAACSSNEKVCSFDDPNNCTTNTAANASVVSAVHNDWVFDVTCLNVAR